MLSKGRNEKSLKNALRVTSVYTVAVTGVYDGSWAEGSSVARVEDALLICMVHNSTHVLYMA